MKKTLAIVTLIAATTFSSNSLSADQIGKYKIGSEKLGIVTVNGNIRALHDSKVQGVTCHVANVSKSISFIDPSNTSIACRQTGPIKIGKINKSQEGENVVFTGTDKHWLGSFFKDQKVRRIYDEANKTLIYVTYTTKVINGSYKQSISTISLYTAK